MCPERQLELGYSCRMADDKQIKKIIINHDGFRETSTISLNRLWTPRRLLSGSQSHDIENGGVRDFANRLLGFLLRARSGRVFFEAILATRWQTFHSAIFDAWAHLT